jgi:hypothetical protein
MEYLVSYIGPAGDVREDHGDADVGEGFPVVSVNIDLCDFGCMTSVAARRIAEQCCHEVAAQSVRRLHLRASTARSSHPEWEKRPLDQGVDISPSEPVGTSGRAFSLRLRGPEGQGRCLETPNYDAADIAHARDALRMLGQEVDELSDDEVAERCIALMTALATFASAIGAALQEGTSRGSKVLSARLRGFSVRPRGEYSESRAARDRKADSGPSEPGECLL